MNSTIVKILDEDKEDFYEVLNEAPNKTYLELDMQKLVTDFGFEKGGNFYLYFSASNAETSQTTLIPFTVENPDDSLYKIITISKYMNSLALDIYDNEFSFEQNIILNAEYASSDVASDLQYVFVAGMYNSGISYFSAEDGLLLQQIYGVNADSIYLFDFPDMEVIKSISLQDTLMNIHLLYNQ